MNTDDMIDIIDAGAARIAHDYGSIIAVCWANNAQEWSRDEEHAAEGSRQLRSDFARLVREKFGKLEADIRALYTREHPLYHRFNMVLPAILEVKRNEVLHGMFYMMARQLPGYVPAAMEGGATCRR